MWLTTSLAAAMFTAPLSISTENPRLLAVDGQTTLLVTSGEHYGAVLNLDFDYIPYLDELAAHGLNQTRTFSGTYREVPGSFGITGNTLAPAEGRYASPWARSDQPGYRLGGPRFDLTAYDPAYFARLRDFVAQAGARGINVEYVFFCPFYNDDLWLANPMHPENNVNGVGNCPPGEVYTLAHPGLLAVQEAFVREAVTQLNEFDNLYYEICNEPYFGGVTLEWQARIAQVVRETEAGLPKRHLIAQNIANNTARVEAPLANVDLYNFHYAAPPVAVADNWHLAAPIGFDESGFAGSDNRVYRAQAWHFIMAGGAVFSNLDYSFTAASPAGSAAVDAPGGGGRDLRVALGALRRFAESLDLARAVPLPEFAQVAGEADLVLRTLGVPGEVYGVYAETTEPLTAPVPITLDLPAGRWRVTWLAPVSGDQQAGPTVETTGGRVRIELPAFHADWALKVSKD